MNERAFVAGATGYTGQAVVSELRTRTLQTTAHIRPDSSSLPRCTERFEALGAAVDMTAWDLGSLTETIAALQPTVVFALLGTTRRRSANEGMDAAAGYERVDYGLSKLLLEACRSAAPQARFVYLSSLGVKEGTRNAYLSARARMERELARSGQPYTIARPSFIAGSDREENRLGERVGAAVANAILTAAGCFGATRTRDRFQSMDAATLAFGLVRAALDPGGRDAVLEAGALRTG